MDAHLWFRSPAAPGLQQRTLPRSLRTIPWASGGRLVFPLLPSFSFSFSSLIIRVVHMLNISIIHVLNITIIHILIMTVIVIILVILAVTVIHNMTATIFRILVIYDHYIVVLGVMAS